MSSAAPGTITSAVEVTNVSKHGFWLLLGDEELFVPFAEFPWFRDAPIGKLTTVEWPSPDHLHWPALDIDLAAELPHILRPVMDGFWQACGFERSQTFDAEGNWKPPT